MMGEACQMGAKGKGMTPMSRAYMPMYASLLGSVG